MKIEKLVKSAKGLAEEVRQNGIPEDLEDGALAWMLDTLAEYCEAFMNTNNLSQSDVRITNLENTCKEARKALLECEALVKDYPLVHQWVLQSLEQLKEFRP